MFYVPGPGLSLIKDETTRYHYFLQLKADVAEGRLRCTLEEAIPLAAYSLQGKWNLKVTFLFRSTLTNFDSCKSFLIVYLIV